MKLPSKMIYKRNQAYKEILCSMADDTSTDT